MESWEGWSAAADEMAFSMRHTRGEIVRALACLHATGKVSLPAAKNVMKQAELNGIDPTSAAKLVEALVLG